MITYRELRLLEVAILRALNKTGQGFLDVRDIIWLDVDMMSGIEYEEFPARIAEVAMWLMDHQMNMAISQEFGQYFVRLPLKKAAHIVHGDALTTDWESVVAKKELSFILGNPPFIGSRIMNKDQKSGLKVVFDNAKDVGELDYVTAWYIKSAQFIQNSAIKVAFVSTNSIVQGLQVNIFWKPMISKYGIIIHFAHKTFKWKNEAKGNAAVYCVIIGFATTECLNKVLYEYEDISQEPHAIKVKNINPYLVDAKNIFIGKSTSSICNVPNMNFGNMPADGGRLLFSTEEKNLFVKESPEAIVFFKPFISAYEFINGLERWCLWLQNIEPNKLRASKLVLERINEVKEIRERSSRPQLAQIPHLFAQITQPPNVPYILIPRHSSENRKFIPIGIFDSSNIAADSCLIIPNGNFFHFGILTSTMHMAWVKTVCGRLKSDYRYSKDIVYNNYPWPENPSAKQIATIETAAQKVLDVRASFPDSSLADLYHPLTMPPALTKAHQELDKAVDLAYRPQAFINETKRMEFLFELYEKYTAGLFAKEKVKKVKA